MSTGRSPQDAVETRARRVRVAGMWRRWLGAVADGLLLLPVLAGVGWLAARVTGVTWSSGGNLRPETVLELVLQGNGLLYGALGLALLIVLVYGSLFLVTTGATPGLRLLRLRVINRYGDGPEAWRVLLRGVGFLICCLTLGLGFVWTGFDREKRGLQDRLAGTYVILDRRAGGGAGA